MLKSIEISNYALIDHTVITFDPKLNIVTGETGAGKSIMLGALGLVMGNRADSKVLFDGDTKCFVEAKYDVTNLGMEPVFDNYDLDYDNTLIIRREIAVSGKSRAFVNDTPATLDILQELSSYLITVHQQFDTLDIQKSPYQLQILDQLADHSDLLIEYTKLYNEWKSNVKMLEQLKTQDSNASKELDFLSFQLEELIEANLIEDNQADLEAELNTLERSEEIKQVLSTVNQSLSEADPSVIDMLNELSGELRQISDIKNSFAEVYERLTSVIEELKDISNESNNFLDDIDVDQSYLEQLKERLNLIYRLQKKHQVSTIGELMMIKDQLQEKLTGFTNLEDRINELEKLISGKYKDLLKVGESISNNRNAVIKPFVSNVEQLLGQLAMPNAKIDVEITPKKEPSINGLDDVVIKFAANKGSQMQAVKEVASGGETSRLALVIKSIMAGKSELPTLIFDEIDTGVSGEVAQKMGQILKTMSDDHQVVIITHAPQIAAKASQHLYVYKEDSDTRTYSKIKSLEGEERVLEIAKMMSGESPTEAALTAARQLMVG